MAGPLVKVDTVVAGINLDVAKQLRLGRTSQMEFVKSNSLAQGGWETIKIVTKNFNRIAGDETIRDDGKTVIFQVADTEGKLAEVLRTKDLHFYNNGQLYQVSDVPKIADNEAQVYTLYCNVRTLKKSYFE